MGQPLAFDSDSIGQATRTYVKSLRTDPDVDGRFTLMAKLFARANVMLPGEEKFLWLWTVLEVYPMRNTSDIAPVSDLLGQITSRDAIAVKNALEIGRLFGARSDLVHDGRLPMTANQMGGMINRLNAIVLAVIRYVGGLPYDGGLDQFFN
jgi:hypothetical protein